jgi:hypothetical protein
MTITPEATVMPDLSAMLTEATLPTVPDGVATYLASQLGYFSASNRNRRTITMSVEMAPFILANRPDLLVSLEGSDLATAVAKEFSHQVKEYASEHGLSCYPRRVACTVSFRFSKPSDKNGDDGDDASDES